MEADLMMYRLSENQVNNKPTCGFWVLPEYLFLKG